MRVSLVVSTYNRAQYLRMWLACAMLQRFQGDFEIVVADDGSTDGTDAVVREAANQPGAPPIRHVWHEHRAYRKALIVNSAVRSGLEGDLLVFMDSDCLPAPDMLSVYSSRFTPQAFSLGGVYVLRRCFSERMLAAHGEIGPDRVLAGAARSENQRKGAARKVGWRRLKSRAYVALGIRKPKIWGGNFAVDSDVFEAVNGLDENYVGYGQEDSDLRNRLLRGGYRPICLHTRARAYHVWHPPDMKAREEALDGRNNRAYYRRRDVDPVCLNGLRKL